LALKLSSRYGEELSVQLVYTAIATLLAAGLYFSRLATAVYLVILTTVSVYNGAEYLFDVLPRMVCV
jgi:hypothetical protein